MAGTVVADTLQAAATSTLLIQTGNGAPVTAVSIDTSQNVKFAGAIRSSAVSTPPTIQDSAGTQIGTFCRAWVNFNGTGTVAIRASFNVSSITDNATGDYTVNFATAMPDANYSAVGQVSSFTSSNTTRTIVVKGTDAGGATNKTTSACQFLVGATGASTLVDMAEINVAIFR